MQSNAETRLQRTSSHVAAARAPSPRFAEYKTAVKIGNVLCVSGHGPLQDGQDQ